MSKYEVQNYGLADRKTVSSDAQFPRYDNFKKQQCHHEEGPPSLFSIAVGLLRTGPKFRFFLISDAPFSKYDSFKVL